MLVFKFGGASVKNAEAVKNISGILRMYDDRIVVVVSAMGKTTNALEEVVDFYFNQRKKELEEAFLKVKNYHVEIMKDLFTSDHPVFKKAENLFRNMNFRLEEPPSMNYDFDYDQIICYGELLSTTIVNAWLNEDGIHAEWRDIRKSLITDDNFREARVNWTLSEELVKKNFRFNDNQLYVTQGFLASTINNINTSLGREGSDYTAAILAYILEAEQVVIWKDVPGVLNADPKWFEETVLLENLSYMDAIELAYYGASVIHPKTIQPLKKKNIPMRVKSFNDPKLPGTSIGKEVYDALIPSFIFKMDQVLIHISARDFSFITEDNLGVILGAFARNGLKVNLMQNTAISFQLCVNNDLVRIPRVIRDLDQLFDISTENGLELVTIRYYDEATIARVTENKEIVLEQHNKNTAQMVMRDLSPQN